MSRFLGRVIGVQLHAWAYVPRDRTYADGAIVTIDQRACHVTLKI